MTSFHTYSGQIPNDLRSQIPSMLQSKPILTGANENNPLGDSQPIQQSLLDPNSSSALVLEQDKYTKRYQIKEGLTPDQYNDYLHSISEDLFDFIGNDLLNTIHYFLSLINCPLQTPSHCQAHHLANIEPFRKYLEDQLHLINDELMNFKQVISKTVEQTNVISVLPSLDHLETCLKQHRNEPEAHLLINYILQAMREIKLHATLMWKERASKQIEIQQTFEEGIRLICSHVMKLYTTLCPDLQNFITQRKSIENLLHDKHKQIKAAEIEVRTKFYNNVLLFAEQQVNIIRNMLNIYKIVLEEHNPENQYSTPEEENENIRLQTNYGLLSKHKLIYLTPQDYQRELERYRSMEKTLNIWLKLLRSHSEMPLPYPILPSQLVELSAWIVLFQRFFVQLLTKLSPKIIPALRPDPIIINHVLAKDEDDNDNNSEYEPSLSRRQNSSIHSTTSNEEEDDDNEEEENKEKLQRQRLINPSIIHQLNEEKQLNETSKVSGLINLEPAIYNFYQTTKTNALKRLMSQEAYHQDILNRHNHMQQELVLVNENVNKNLKEAQLLEVFHQFNQTSKDAQEVLQLQSQASNFHSNQYQIERMAQWMKQQKEQIERMVIELRPKIETQKSLVQSLNQVMYTLNNSSKETEEAWKTFTEEELNLCLFWKTSNLNFQTEYLNFRAQTRILIETQLDTARSELSKCLQHSFRDLLNRYSIQGNEMKENLIVHLVAISNARALIQIYHNQLIDKKLTDVNNEVDRLSLEIDQTIREKEQLDWREDMLSMQNSLTLFSNAMMIMIDKLFNDPQIQSYLETLDHVCCLDNKTGGAPLPRSIQPNHPLYSTLSSNPLTWFQIVEYPERYNVSNLFANSNRARKDSTAFIIDYKGYRDEPIEIAKRRTVADMMREFSQTVNDMKK